MSPVSSRLQSRFKTEITPTLKESLKLANVNEVPRLQKIVLNVGAGRAAADKKYLELAAHTLAKITGQKPVSTKSRHSIAAFKLREGVEIGVKVTLRGSAMYDFLDRLISIVLPRMRDFHGLPRGSFDQKGNYSIGLPEQSVFPELSYEETATLHGLQIILVTTALTPERGMALLSARGLPFEKTDEPEGSTS